MYAAVKHGHGNANVALCISLKTRAHTIFTAMIDCRPVKAGNEWIIHFLKNADIHKAVVDGNGSKTLIEQCSVVGFRKITAPKVSEVIQAKNDFEQAIFPEICSICSSHRWMNW